MNKLKRFVLTVLAFGVFVYLFLLSMIIGFGFSSKEKEADCVIVLGCRVYGKLMSPFLMERTDKGLSLLNEGKVKYIIVSGGKGQGEGIEEAEAMKEYLIAKGVSKEKILVENKSKNTYENLKYSKEIMNRKNLKSAIIVSNKFHLFRSMVVAKKFGINASYQGVFVKKHIGDEIYGYLREPFALIKYIVKSYI
ncbi:YdcF family protein [Caloramator sp. ALD01]|uniref:YdcF family protein n=1 Tax=Caloramator sp. ALD01 TaxID=1031288 RepID=UPI00040910D0|nr:YdcF family protein [Caloramator sp. ALD01]